MTNSKKTIVQNVSLSVEELLNRSAQKRTSKPASDTTVQVRNGIFITGLDKRVSTKPPVSTPQIKELDLLLDGLNNPYIKLTFSVKRSDVESNGISYFNVYRRKLPANVSFALQPIDRFDSSAFDKLSRKTKKQGKFSIQSKALSQINRSMLDLSVVNKNLHFVEESNKASTNKTDTSQTTFATQDHNLISNVNQFYVLSTIDVSKYLDLQKLKKVNVSDSENITIAFEDLAISYGDSYEYYVSSLSDAFEESSYSQPVKMTVEDLTAIRAPQAIKASQIDESTIRFSVTLDSRDNVSRIVVYRRSEDEVSFSQLFTVKNITDKIQFDDSGLHYGKTYTYRVFAINIHGTLSFPREITVFCTSSRVITKSKSNNFKVPIITALQDQNSNFIKVQIPVNDSKIAFYKLERKDLTIHEKKWQVPELDTTNYGSKTNPWVGGGLLFIDTTKNKFVATNQTQTGQFLSSDINAGSTIVNTQGQPTQQGFSLNDVNKVSPQAVTSFNNPSDQTLFNLVKQKENSTITFIDDTVQIGHTYSYRVRGYDLFGNTSSYSFSTVTVTGKNSIRTPINFNASVLRSYPFRLKLTWQDDNEKNVPHDALLSGTILEAGSLAVSTISDKISTADKKIFYKVERRKIGEIKYQTFPLTLNSFVIDEAQSIDNIPFSTQLIRDTFSSSANLSHNNLTIKTQNSSSIRPFGTPEFLSENNTYFYRVSAISDDGVLSNPTEEFPIVTIGDLSEPVNFALFVQDNRIRPIVVKCSWAIQRDKFIPDYWIIERKIDIPNDTFQVIGIAYIETQFFDRNVQPGNNYIYRIRSVDVFGRQTKTVTQTIKL